MKHYDREEKRPREITINVDRIFTVLFAGLSVAGIVSHIRTKHSLNQISKKINVSLDDLKNKTTVEITDDILNRYTSKAVQKAADKAAEGLSYDLRSELYDILEEKVSEAVANQYDNVKDEVAKELRKQVSKISVSGLRREIKDEVKRAVSDKLSTEMDDILTGYNDQLNSIGKIYNSIAESMSGKSSL